MISICIPTYNPEIHFLEHCIKSCLNQTFSDIEIIINDDNSINRPQILNLISTINHKKIHFFNNKKNLGMVGNWNECVSKSNGEYILLLGQDDIIDKELCETFFNEFTNDNLILCSSAREFIDENSKILNRKNNFNDRRYIFQNKNKYILNSKNATKLSLTYGNIIGEPSCVMYHKKSFLQIDGYDNIFFHAADLDFNLRMLKLGNKMSYINKPLLKRRIHSDNLTIENYIKGHVSNERKVIYNRHRENFNFSEKTINIFKSYIFLSSIKDIFKSIRILNSKLLVSSIYNSIKYFTLSPFIYFTRLKELIFKKRLIIKIN